MEVLVYDLNSRKRATLGEKIADGGEGEIRKVLEDRRFCAKIYHKGRGSYEKIVAMLKNRPEDPMNPEHTSLAWPTGVVFNERGSFLGFVMPYFSHSVPVHEVYGTDLRIRKFGGCFNWYYLLTSAVNFASVTASVHAKGHAIGDMNEKNIQISPRAVVTLIDCDSFIIRCNGKTYKNGVGVGEYSAPEVLLNGYESRSERSDRFAVAVFIFKLLMLGFHPFSGKWNGGGEPPTLESRIGQGITPYFGSGYELDPPLNAPSITILPEEVRLLFKRGFVDGHRSPSLRPTALEWFRVLKPYMGRMENGCGNPNHFHISHLDTCPWCKYTQKTGIDPFPAFLACSACGSRNSWNAIYCEKCSHDLAQEYRECHKCTSSIPANSIYCRICGCKVRAGYEMPKLRESNS
jgi:DNA-binding helix-hairpin-helix protein with protein kinase domain